MDQDLFDLPQLQSHKDLHQFFVSATLLDCGTLKQHDLFAEHEQASWECQQLKTAYKALVLRYGAVPADLKSVIAAFATAVLRVSQAMGGAAGKLIAQKAHQAAEHVHAQLGSFQRDKQLLEVAKCALGASGLEHWSWQGLLQQCANPKDAQCVDNDTSSRGMNVMQNLSCSVQSLEDQLPAVSMWD